MRRRHSFHLDQGGHSVTVNVRAGHITETEVLVDGKECAFHRVRGHGAYPLSLTSEFAEPADGPALPITVRLERTGRSEQPLNCVLELAGTVRTMPETTAH